MSSFPLPSVTPPTLANFQMQYNGVTLGAGTAYGILGAEGLDLPVVRNGDVSRPRTTGEFIGLDLLGGRDVILTLDATGTGSNLQAVLQALAGAFVPPANGQTELPLWIQLPNMPLLNVSGRVRKRQIPIDLPWSTGSYAQKIVIQLHCTDPRVYANTVASVVTLATPPGGMTFPALFPLTFGGGGAGNTVTVNNTGDFQMYPLVTITGPVTNPVITNQTTGQALTFSNPNQTTFTLNTGDQLVVDLDAHNVTYIPNGATVGSSRRNWIVYGSTWWGLAPGNNIIEFTSGDASLPSPAPTMTVDWAPAYVSAT